MVKRSKGKYSKRGRNLKSKGKVSITKHLQEFKEGDSVRIAVNPRYSQGMPFLRFNNRAAVVVGKQGEGVVLKVSDLGKEKTLIVSNLHLEHTR